MQSLHLENIALLLSLQTVHIKVPCISYPPHWKAGQRLSKSPQSLGGQIRKHRLELHWLQADLAKAIGVHVVSVSNWERGTPTPSRRMMKRFRHSSTTHPNSFPEVQQLVYAPGNVRCTKPLANFVSLKRSGSISTTTTYIHRFMQLTFPKCVPVVAGGVKSRA